MMSLDCLTAIIRDVHSIIAGESLEAAVIASSKLAQFQMQFNWREPPNRPTCTSDLGLVLFLLLFFYLLVASMDERGGPRNFRISPKLNMQCPSAGIFGDGK
jgi:hypothetical protein